MNDRIIRRIRMTPKRTAAALLCVLMVVFSGCSMTSPVHATTSPASSVSASDITAESSSPSASVPPQGTPGVAQIDTGDHEPVASLSALNQEYAAYGSMTIAGMAGGDYDAAMAATWTEIETPGSPAPLSVDLAELMDYKTIEQSIFNLGKYDGVDVFKIGESELGRNIYMLKIGLPGEYAGDKPLLMLTGSVHAREFAGAEFTLKFLTDTLAKAQTDAYTRALLERVTIVAVPLVNPDGRELIIAGGDPSRKSNANGVDLNRAMPAVNAGQLIAGASLPENFSVTPGMDFFAGSRLGTESETQAMMKWMSVFVPQASAYIDLHQQGGVMFYNKPFTSSESDDACFEFAQSVNDLLDGGYRPKKEDAEYSINGDGGTMTDYARSISEGFVFSYRLGRMALLMDGVETPLISFGDIDKYMDFYHPVNRDFLCMTIEIGRKPTYLGASEDARERRADEYEEYGWRGFLTGTIEILLGEETVDHLHTN